MDCVTLLELVHLTLGLGVVLPVAPASMRASAWTRPRPRAPPETMMTLSRRLISGRTPGTGGLLPGAGVRAARDVWNGREEEVIAAPKVMGLLAAALRAGANLDIVNVCLCLKLGRGRLKGLRSVSVSCESSVRYVKLWKCERGSFEKYDEEGRWKETATIKEEGERGRALRKSIRRLREEGV